MSELIKAMKKLLVTVGVSVLALAALFTVIGFVSSKTTSIPDEYFEAKDKAARVANELSELVSDSLNDLNEIQTLDRQKKTREALTLIERENERRQEKLSASITLASSLEYMAHITEAITPESASRLALENISTGVTMVSRLVSYNTYFDQVFQALNYKFSTGKALAGVSIQSLITKMNQEALAINTLNERFNLLEDKFDETYGE